MPVNNDSPLIQNTNNNNNNSVYKQTSKKTGRFTIKIPKKVASSEKKIQSILDQPVNETFKKENTSPSFKERFLSAFNWKYLKSKTGSKKTVSNTDHLAAETGLKPAKIQKDQETLNSALQNNFTKKIEKDFDVKIKKEAVSIPIGSELSQYLDRQFQDIEEGELKKTYLYFDKQLDKFTLPNSSGRMITLRPISNEAYKFENIYVYREKGQYFVHLQEANIKLNNGSEITENIEDVKKYVNDALKNEENGNRLSRMI